MSVYFAGCKRPVTVTTSKKQDGSGGILFALSSSQWTSQAKKLHPRTDGTIGLGNTGGDEWSLVDAQGIKASWKDCSVRSRTTSGKDLVALMLSTRWNVQCGMFVEVVGARMKSSAA